MKKVLAIGERWIDFDTPAEGLRPERGHAF